MTCTTVDCEAPATWRWDAVDCALGREWHGRSCDEHIHHATNVARQAGYSVGVIGRITETPDEVMPAS